jgi:hypothetical protein
MRDENTIVRERQRFIRREMDRRGIALKQVQLDGGWDTPSTVASYFPADPAKEPATMSVASLYRLLTTKALPADLLSLLLPADFAIVRVPEGVDYDEIAEWAETYTAKKLAAHRADSECQEQIGPNESAELDAVVVAFPGKVAA